MTDEQKSIVVDVKMASGAKLYMLECDKILRACTIPCGSSALHQGIGRGDEVLFTINGKDQFSYLKATGQKFKLDELPKPAGGMIDVAGALLGLPPIIDADKEQGIKEEHIASGQIVPGEPLKPTGESTRILHEVHRSEIIMWEALLNTATDIVMMSGVPSELGLVDVVKRVENTAECLHEFIMVKVGEGK